MACNQVACPKTQLRLEENTIRYLGRELEVRKAAEEQEAAGGRD